MDKGNIQGHQFSTFQKFAGLIIVVLLMTGRPNLHGQTASSAPPDAAKQDILRVGAHYEIVNFWAPPDNENFSKFKVTASLGQGWYKVRFDEEEDDVMMNSNILFALRELNPEAIARQKAKEDPIKDRARRARCLDHLRMLNGAIQQYMLENTTTNVPRLDQIGDYFQTGEIPKCPSGGVYSPPATPSDVPTCSHPGHELK